MTGKDDFKVVGRVEGELVVLGVAGPEGDVVVPAEEAEDAREESVEPAGFEDRVVDQLVESVDQEVPAGPVDIEGKDQEVPGGSAGGEVCGGTGCGQQGEKADGLEKSLEVALAVDGGEVVPLERDAIPF